MVDRVQSVSRMPARKHVVLSTVILVAGVSASVYLYRRHKRKAMIKALEEATAAGQCYEEENTHGIISLEDAQCENIHTDGISTDDDSLASPSLSRSSQSSESSSTESPTGMSTHNSRSTRVLSFSKRGLSNPDYNPCCQVRPHNTGILDALDSSEIIQAYQIGGDSTSPDIRSTSRTPLTSHSSVIKCFGDVSETSRAEDYSMSDTSRAIENNLAVRKRFQIPIE